MTYTADISRPKPTRFLLSIDLPGPMTQVLSGQLRQRKMNQAEDAINRTLDDLAPMLFARHGYTGLFPA